MFEIKIDFRGIVLKLNKRSAIMGGFLFLILLIGLCATLSDFRLIGHQKTRVKIAYGGENYDFQTNRKTLKEALADKGIVPSDQDKTNLSLAQVLNGKAVKGTIDKALPVVIFDGYTRIFGRSTSSDSEIILADNNIEIVPEDKVSSNLILDPVTTGSAGLAVYIKRAPTYKVFADGKTILVRSWDNSVATVLEKSGIRINPQDEVKPLRIVKLLPGETIIVTRVNEVDLPVIVAVPFETENVTSSSLGFGKTQITQQGANGQVKRIYHVIYKNGIEVSRRLKSTTTTQAVKNKIVTRGQVTGRANFGYYSGMVTSFYKGLKGHHLLVTNLANGKQVTVEIIGSGPFNGPLMDMGTEPFKAIGGSLVSGYLPSVSVVLLD